ncbi:putative RNA-directed DNA polymerase [Helianthus annuus]|nr:putative RNA-directed DNA polymerase [Helianthus annuus]
MTGEKEFFTELNTNVTGHVCFGDGSKVEIKGKGTLLFQCKNGDQLMIPQVYFTPALTSNILSLGQMTEDGYDISMRNEFLKVRDVECKLVMKVQRSKNRLYKIVLQHTKPICLATKVEEDAWLWHARFAHANFQLLEQMGKRGHVNGLPIITHPNQLCEGCLIAKQARGSFPNKALWRATRPLELLHADLCGRITPKSLGVEKESDFEMKMLRTDMGGEFNSQAFDEFCQENGIRRQKTVPYTPQQNGVVDRRNRTVMGMTRAMLKAMEVPDMFWGEAVSHVVYVLNMVLTKAVKDATPFEKWKGKKPNTCYLRVFGCVGFAIKLKGHKSKLEDRSRPLVYLGVEHGTLGFKLYDPRDKRVIIAGEGDVKFDERKAWAWGQKPHACDGTFSAWMLSLSYWSHGVDDDSDNTMQSQSEESGGWDHNNGPTTPNISTPNSNVSPQMFSHAGTSSHEVEMTHTPNLQHATNEGSSPSFSSQSLDNTPLQGKRNLNEVYNAKEAMSEQEVQELYAQEGELYLINDEPESYVEAMVDPNWKKAMDLELDSINKNKTWTLVDLPKDHKAIRLKWVFKLKKDTAGNVIKHKARVVAKGYVQQKGIDFDDAFALVARLETIRLLLALAAKGN